MNQQVASSSLPAPHKHPHHYFKISKFHRMSINSKADLRGKQSFSNITNEIIYKKALGMK